MTASVGRGGGALELASGAKVDIPRDALPEDTQIRVAEVQRESLAENPRNAEALEMPVAMTPHGTRFLKPVDVSLPRNAASSELETSEIRVLRLANEQATAWEEVGELEVRAESVRFKIETFSIYVIGKSLAATDTQPEGGMETSDTDSGTGTRDAGTLKGDGGSDAPACELRLTDCDVYNTPGDPESGVYFTTKTDLHSDVFNCGTCNTGCADNEACLEGECTTAVTGQVLGEQTCVDCGESFYIQGTRSHCVFPLSDSRHCGSCGVTCTNGEVCQGGSCQPAACCDGLTRCGEYCLDTQGDSNNCGGCNVVCDATEACVEGSCTSTCPEGQTRCRQECVDPLTDTENCGGCTAGASVGGPGGCSQGACTTGQCDCGGKCFDVTSDNNNCGYCGNVCTTDNTCIGSECACTQMQCTTGECSCGGACIDPSTDNNNCGLCGHACDANERCNAGECETVSCDAGYVLCGSGPSAHCYSGDACPSGNYCSEGQSCVAGSCQ